MSDADPRLRDPIRRDGNDASPRRGELSLLPPIEVDDPDLFALVPIIATKLAPPGLPTALVARPLPAVLTRPATMVTTIVAAAGYGKSVLARQWTDSQEPEWVAAWYSLDSLDSNPLSFWRHLVAALAGAVAIGPEPESVLLDRGAADPAFLHTLVHRLLAAGTQVTLVLDDLHHLTDRTALDHLALLVERADPWLRLVVTARVEPALPLARWKLRGQLTEIREDDLRFDADATAALLSAYGCGPLDAVGLDAAVRHSEGWVAGLQLAALARPDDVVDALHDLPGRGTVIAGYLVGEVLDRLPEAERDMALAISVFDEFDLALAVELTSRSDAGELLRRLHAGHVFLVRTGPTGSTYRFHHLFRELLRQELRARDAQRWASLHRRASTLLSSRGQIDAAFDHLMVIDDVDGAIDLVVRRALVLSDLGLGHAFGRWLEQLPRELDVSTPDVMLDLAFAYFSGGRLADATMWMDRAEPLCGSNDPRLVSRRLMVAIAAGEWDTCRRIVDTFAAPGSASADSFEDRFEMLVARVHLALDDIDAAAAALERADLVVASPPVRRVTLPAMRARIRARTGDVRAAESLARAALVELTELGIGMNPAALEARVALAAAMIGHGASEEAAVAVDELLDVAEVVDYPYSRALAAGMVVQLHALRHGWSTVYPVFGELCRLAGWSEGDPMAEVLDPLLVRALIASGRLEEAQATAGAMRVGPLRCLALANVAVAWRRTADVVELLRDRAEWCPADQVEALVVLALAAPSGEGSRHIRDALRLAGPLGLAGPFTGRGAQLDGLVAAAPSELLSPLGLSPDSAGARRSERAPELIEPLTSRERELLAMLPTHLSNAAMGERMYVSVNTVKTHLKAVYRKLNTTSRDEAVVTARRLGLLPADPAKG